MTPILKRHGHGRGFGLDAFVPVESACLRPAPLPPATVSDYLSHRLSFDAPDGRLACDCGDSFDTATELERHQGGYRHRTSDLAHRR